nr:immunoglobulin heavy chain junction region [Macaca mulatta]
CARYATGSRYFDYW